MVSFRTRCSWVGVTIESSDLGQFFYRCANPESSLLCRLWTLWFDLGALAFVVGMPASLCFLLWNLTKTALLFIKSAPQSEVLNSAGTMEVVIPGVTAPLALAPHYWAALALALAAHEAGHALAAGRHGLRCPRAGFFLLAWGAAPGAFVEVEAALARAPPRARLAAAAAGAWHNLALAAGGAALLFAAAARGGGGCLPALGRGAGAAAVTPGSPLAAHVGPGDTLVGLAGRPVRGAADARAALADLLAESQKIENRITLSSKNHSLKSWDRDSFSSVLSIHDDAKFMNAQLNHEEWWLKNAGYCLPHDAPVLRSQHEKMKKHGLNHQPSTEEDHSFACCSEIGQSSNQCFVVATTSHFGDREVVEVGNPNGTGTLFCAKVREVSAQASPVMCKNVQDCMMMYEAGAHSQHDSAASWSCAQPLTMPSELLLQLSFQQVQCPKATNKGGEQGSYNVGMTGGKNDANNSTANKQEKNSCKKTVFYEGDINSFLESLILSDWSLASSSNSNNADDTAEASSSACFLHLLLSPGALIKAMEVFCRFTEIFIQVSLSIAFFNIVPMPLLDSYHALDPILDLCLSMVYTTLPVHYYVNSCCLGGTKHSNLSFKKSRFKFCLTLAGSCLMGANLIMGVLPLLVMRMRWS